jgi:hypothetical protein
MRFGRSRVQDRARYSDVETVIEDPSAETDPPPDLGDAHEDAHVDAHVDVFGDVDVTDAPAYESSLFVDSHTLTQEEEGDADPEGFGVSELDANEPDAIDELRAATTAADARAPELSTERVVEIHRLHEVTVEAQQRVDRLLSTPRARRRLHDAVTEESDALHMLGFASYDDFVTASAAMPTVEARRDDNAETIARIAEILAEIGIDPSADPLEAAREFLAVHEDDLIDAIDAIDEPVSFPDTEDEPEAAATEEATEEETEKEVATSLAEAASAIEMATAQAEASALTEAAAAVEGTATEGEWVPAAQFRAADTPAETPDRDEEIVDRWISAEARAERMHSEVDRAQAELSALLARSTELESTVVARANERDTAHADLDAARTRVTELEASIAQSDLERAEIEAALATGRDRIVELERIAADREQAYEQSERDRADALGTIETLETNLATRTSELEQSRAAVELLEAQTAAQVADLDLAREALDTTREALEATRESLETTRDDAHALRTELETTRRSVAALDEHAEAMEAELAEARRKADSPEARLELEAAQQALDAARNEIGELEARRTETEAILERDRAELDRLREELAKTRELTTTARTELSAARNAYEATKAKADAAERAREAITIDAAELLARAEADAANLLERARRDAEAIRQEARLENPNHESENDAITQLADHVDRLERKLSKQRRKLDEISSGKLGSAPARKRDAQPGSGVTPEAMEIVAAAERDAAEIRRAARQDRERFREELVGLLSRLAPSTPDD